MNQKNMKKIALMVSLANACSLLPVFADNIIRTPAPILPGNGGWISASPLEGEWTPGGTPSCQEWAPHTDTVGYGKPLTQTRECTSSESRTIQARQYNRALDEYRLVGDPRTENREMVSAESRDVTGTKAGLVVLNGVPGVDGIYSVKDKATDNIFNAYVNMTDDGGNWVLAIHWVNPGSISRTMGDFVAKGRAVKPYTANAAYPVVPNGLINGSTHGLLKSENAGWISTFGSWQSFPLFEQGFTITGSGYSVNTPIGPKTLYTQSNAWGGTGGEASIFAFWAHNSSGSVCGRSGAAGTTKICPITNMSNWASHGESAAKKFFFLKAE